MTESERPGAGDGPFFEPLLRKAETIYGAGWTPKGRRRLVEALRQRQEMRRFDLFSEYASHLRRHPEEWAQVWPLALNSESRFLQPEAQYEVARDLLLEWATLAPERRLDVLSLGCGPGPEPYSLALTLAESGLSGKGWQVTIHCLDLNPRALEKVRLGIFQDQELEWLTSARRKKWFTPKGGGFGFKTHLALPLKLGEGNVYEPETWPWPDLIGRCHLIFCRGLSWEAPPGSLRKLARITRAAAAPGGFIFTGLGEFWPDSPDELILEERAGVTYYRRDDSRVKANPPRKAKMDRQAAADDQEPAALQPRETGLLTRAEEELEAGRPDEARELLEELMLSNVERGRPALEAWRILERGGFGR